MSSLSTPTRLGRGLVIPGIDTKPSAEQTNTALSYGGLHTPPQSAHESRRPSLQYSGLSEAPYSAASYTYSQPATPVHGMHQTNEVFTQRWSQSMEVESTANTNLSMQCSTSPIADHSFQDPFESTTQYNSTTFHTSTAYGQLDQADGVDEMGLRSIPESPSGNTWRASQDISNGYVAHNACLGPNLFPLPPGMSVPANSPVSVFDQMHPSFSNLNYDCVSSNMNQVQGYHPSSSLYQSPQVVVPSQLAPQEDYSEQQTPQYTNPSRSHDAVNSSFASSSMSFNEFEMIGMPSPMETYFAHSEDEDYLMVKREDQGSPVPGPSRRTSRMSGRAQRNRNPCNRNRNRNPCRGHELNGIVIDCKGKQCCLGPLQVEVAGSKKPFKCKHFDEKTGEPCRDSFERSEHLKRHEGKHSSERKYPCPLPSCNLRIGRPDNAGDHFKTHLRLPKKGKRNSTCDWPVLRDAIWNEYADKKAARKLLDNLERWINAGMPESSGNRRAGRN